MLETLRKSTSGIVAKILIGILAISFLFWGIEDVFRGYRQGELAKVGDITITNNAYETAFRREIEQFSRQIGQRLTQEQARMFGLDQRTLDSLVGSATIDNHAQAMKLAIPAGKIIEDVRSTPAFQGIGGRFDRDSFNNFLRQMGLSEQGYADIRAKEMLRTHITNALLYGVQPPQAAVDLIHQYSGEKRVVEYFEIDPKVLPKASEPTEAQIKKLYEDQKTTFVRPEYRKVNVLFATADALKSRVAVTDEAVRKNYEAAKSRYNEAERRTIQQVSFKSLAEAQKARAEIAAGKSFLEVAKATGASESDVNLGTFEKSEMLDPRVAEAAFKLKKDEVSQPVEGKFSTVLVKATDIKPAVVRTYDDVKDVIRTEMQRERARAEAQKAHDSVDDQRLSGKTLKEIAETSKLKFVQIPAVDKQGLTPDGKPALESPDLAAIVAAVFKSEVGLENESLQSSDGGYIWIDVVEVTAEKQKAFDEVKDEVAKLWRKNSVQEAVSKLATDLVKKAEGGAAMDALAKEAGASLKTSDPVRRIDQGGGISRSTIARAFALGKGQAASVPTDDGNSRVVFKVKDIQPAKPANPVEASGISDRLVQEMRTDTVASYITALQQRFKPDINRQAFDRLTGRTTAIQ
ncbi:MAG: hypothetical protein RLZ98_2148 [Pseudomonadota bacterium]|jgi:peptidyl-prolyl cis-trans isomerase D